MATSDFQRSLARVLVYEGGKADDPRDPGGRTNKGITQATYNAYLREQGQGERDVYGITDAEVSDIYETKFWDEVQGDKLPVGLDFCVFDAAVNSGVGRAGLWLQQALGDSYQGQNDGRIGSKTLQAIQGHGDVSGLIGDFCQRRLGTLKRLTTFKTFGKGWSARIANVQKISEAWADADDTAAPHPIDVSSAGGHQKAEVDDNLVQPAVSPVVTHVVAGAGSIATVATQSAQQITPIADTFGWAKYAAAGLTLAAVIAGIIIKLGTDATTAAQQGAAKQVVNLDADSAFPSVPVTDPKPSVPPVLTSTTSTAALAAAAPQVSTTPAPKS